MATSIRILIGRRIRNLRKARGWQQLDLALAMVPEENQNYISVIERGKTDITVSMAERIAKGLDVHISRLFVDIENAENESEPKPQKKRR